MLEIVNHPAVGEFDTRWRGDGPPRCYLTRPIKVTNGVVEANREDTQVAPRPPTTDLFVDKGASKTTYRRGELPGLTRQAQG